MWWADDHHVLYNGSKSAELPIGARPREAVKQPPLRLADSDIPRVFDHTHLGVTLASNLRWDDHIDRLGGKVAGYVHLCRTLAFRHNMRGMAIRRFFVAFIRPRLEYCSAVWCGASPALLKNVEKSSSEWQERSSGIRPCRTCLRSNRLVCPLCRGEGENTALAFFGSFLLGKVLLHYRPHWCLVHSYGLLAFLTPFVFHLLRRLVTCRPFSVKLSPSGTGCLLLSSLLRLSLPFDQQFDATLSLICSPMVYLSYFLSFLW